MREFKSLRIWQDGILLVKLVYKLVNQLPANEQYGLRSQMCRAAVSIPSNIAEGCSRKSQKDFSRFLEIALGSAFELETQSIIMIELNLLTERNLKDFNEVISRLQKQINSLKQKTNS